MQVLTFMLIMFQLTKNLLTDCIPGETWFEKCRKCTCKSNKRPVCVFAKCNSIAVCPFKMIWIDQKIRCYCDKAMQHSVCVEMKFQTEMTGYPCQPDVFFHDSCSICICQGGKSKCVAFDRCFNPKAGICNENEYKISNCYKCTCTHTRFRECIMIEECRIRGSKNGKCPKLKNISFDISCIVPLAPQCRYDHDCPDDEKCCQLSQCSSRCRKATPAP